MDLTSGRLYSLDAYPKVPSYPSVEDDLACDVLVIGGGEAGAFVARSLQRQGIDTVMVDKRRIASGTTAASTGLLQFENDKMLIDCIRSFGEHKAVRLYRLCAQALEDLKKAAASVDEACGFRETGSLRYASRAGDADKLRAEYAALRRHGFQVELWDEREIAERYSFRRPAALFSPTDAQADTYKLVHALVADSARRGLRVFEETGVVAVRRERSGPVATTMNGCDIRARRIVFATGYETQQFRANPNTIVDSTYVVVTQPLPPAFEGWHRRSLLWETANPYLYLRTTADNRIVCGGLDEYAASAEERDRRLPEKSERLLGALRDMFPQYGELRADYTWGAYFARTRDGLPLFGEQEGYPDCFFALGYGGNGTINAMMGADVICELVTKGYHPDADLFAFDRMKAEAVIHR
ncbi:FAD-binding oxidoreductase [Paenibacillus sp. TRM 82003]|nr:FAD-binding oxidoreductase [Paenibacillus sp. TRM 82003]